METQEILSAAIHHIYMTHTGNHFKRKVVIEDMSEWDILVSSDRVSVSSNLINPKTDVVQLCNRILRACVRWDKSQDEQREKAAERELTNIKNSIAFLHGRRLLTQSIVNKIQEYLNDPEACLPFR